MNVLMNGSPYIAHHSAFRILGESFPHTGVKTGSAGTEEIAAIDTAHINTPVFWILKHFECVRNGDRYSELPGQAVTRSGRNNAQACRCIYQGRSNFVNSSVASHGNNIHVAFSSFL